MTDSMRMITAFSPLFELTEEHSTRSLSDIASDADMLVRHRQNIGGDNSPPSEQHKLAFVELNYPNDSAMQMNIVSKLIAAIYYCWAEDIPLLLNRSGDTLDKTALTCGFKLGIQSSGTTGKPKWVLHHFDKLLHALKGTNNLQYSEFDKRSNEHEPIANSVSAHRWLLTYHPFSFAGIQVILQCLVSGSALFSFTHLRAGELAKKAILHNITAISCTPSMFRTLNLTWQSKQRPPLSILSLGGEIATQSILDEAKRCFAKASVRHIYASTEAGVLFSVKDCLAGFPKKWLGQQFKGWLLSIDNNQLVLTKQNDKQSHTAGSEANTEFIIDTGDRITLNNERCLFVGRLDNIINVGGVKVDALAIENQIIGLDAVVDARVYAKPNPIVTNVIAVEIVSSNQLRTEAALNEWKQTVLSVQQPRLVTWVDAIQLSDAGKKQRTET